MRELVCLVCLAACHRTSTDHATIDPRPTQPEAAVAAPASAAPIVHDAGPPADIVWRVLDHKYVENDAGYPIEMWVNVQLEIASNTFGPWKFAAPACTIGSPFDKNGIAQLACYYGGAGDYVEVLEKKGEYVIIRFGQGEGYSDEPAPKKEGLTTIGSIKTKTTLGSDAIITADGGVYKAYGP